MASYSIYVRPKAMAGEGEFVVYPGVNPAIKNAEKVAQNMILLDVPTARS